MLFYIIIVLFLNTSTILAQNSNCGISLTLNDTAATLELERVLNFNVAKNIKQLPKLNKKEMIEAYRVRAFNIKQQARHGDFYFEPEITDYFQTIFQNIVSANPVLAPYNLQLLISRYPYPNAYCTGAGTLVFNLELLSWLENESQVAFVICHEIAHHTFGHVNTALTKRIDYLNTRETKKELKKIAKSQTNTNTKATEFLQDFVYEDRRHSRLHEATADSMALVYLNNTTYDAAAALSCLAILDKVDGQRFEQDIEIEQIFHTQTYPFKSHWLEQETSIFDKVKKVETWDKDSIKTHPDCSKRIDLLTPQLANYQQVENLSNTAKTSSLKAIQFQANLELIHNAYLYKSIGKSLYYTLLLLEQYPEEACLHAMVGKSLYAIHQAQKKHELTEILDSPAAWQPIQYQTLLKFLEGLRLKEIAQLNYAYLYTRKEEFIHHKAFHHALILATEVVENEKELAILEDLWKEKYSK